MLPSVSSPSGGTCFITGLPFGNPPTCPSQRLVGALSLSGVGRHAEAGRWLPTEQVGWLLEPELEMMSWVTDSVK